MEKERRQASQQQLKHLFQKLAYYTTDKQDTAWGASHEALSSEMNSTCHKERVEHWVKCPDHGIFNLPEKIFNLDDKEEDMTSNVDTRPSKLCAPTQSVDACLSHIQDLYGVHPMGVLYAVRKAQRASSSLSDQEARFSPTVLSRILFKPRFDTSTCPLVWDDTRWRDDE
ncbi:hypothetical protein Tco_0802110 [Tanacetum coccineum]|uniref:Uncharacterized protein n=1 Tax=Tanacetum coccineum TaxID=301880 RepID=A0ABQ5A233_9ASTR